MPDVAPFLDRAAVVLVPIATGGGVRVKLLDALAAGKAIVATRRACAGLGVEGGHHLVLAETDVELAEAVAELLERPERRRELAAAARSWAASAATWEDVAQRYEELYRGGKVALEMRELPDRERQRSRHG